MNVNVIWQGQDITEHVVEYTRQHDICTGVGSLDLIVEGDTDFNFLPWNSIIIKELGSQVAKYNITSWEREAPGGTYIIAAQDNSKRLTDYFLDKEYNSETLSSTRYWIELILSEAGVTSYSINVDSDDDGEPVTIGSQFGMRAAYEAILNLLQLSGWFMYFDANGTCQIGELDTNKSPVHDFYGHDTIGIRTTYSDKMLRNRIYIWGEFSERNQSWVHAKAETYLPWFRDDGQDWRSTVYQNSSIYYYSTALKMAEKILAEFSRQVPEKEVQVIGLHPNLQVGAYVRILGTYGTGVGQISSFIVNVNKEGATTTMILDKRCPRLFGISDIKGDYIYIGTNNKGVWRKSLKGGYWYAYNSGIESVHVRDLVAYNALLACTTINGELYTNAYGTWSKFVMPSGLKDELGNPIVTSSGYFVSCAIDKTYGTMGGINTVYTTISTTSGFQLLDGLPSFPASGNRSWIVGLSPAQSVLYTHQLNYLGASGIDYDIAAVDLETNDLGENIISISSKITKIYTSTMLGSYNRDVKNESYGNYNNKYLGKNFYTTLPKPAGIEIYPADYGGTTGGGFPGWYYPAMFYSVSGYDSAFNNFFRPFGDPDNALELREAKVSLETGDIYEDYTDYTFTENTPKMNGGPIKIIKMDDNTYHMLGTSLEEDNGIILYEVNLSTETVTKIGKFFEPTYESYYASTGNIEYWFGTDSDYAVKITCFGDTSDDDTFDAPRTCVHIINVRTGTDLKEWIYGAECSYTLNLSNHYIMQIVDISETPNYIIGAIYSIREGWYGEGGGPIGDMGVIIYPIVIDKYNGAFKLGNSTSAPLYPEGEKASVFKHEFDPNFSMGEQYSWQLRDPFVKGWKENIETGVGYAKIYVPVKYHTYKTVTPLVEGYEYEFLVAIVGNIQLPNGSTGVEPFYMGTERHWRTGYPDEYKPFKVDIEPWMMRVGNFHVRGVWEPVFLNSDVIQALHSRNVDNSPVYFGGIREEVISEDAYPSLANPDNPTNHVHVTKPPGVTYLGGLNGTDGVAGMLDDVDDSFYISDPLGLYDYSDIWGFDLDGNIVKHWDLGASTGPVFPIFNKVKSVDGSTFIGLKNWPASGINNTRTKYKLLKHIPSVVPSGQFSVMFEWNREMAIDTGMGIPITAYDMPMSGGGILGSSNSSLLAFNYGGSGVSTDYTFDSIDPYYNITDARVVDIYDTNYFITSGGGLPDFSINKFVGAVDGRESMYIYNTEPTEFSNYYIKLVTMSGDIINHLDFTNFYPAPYIFASVITVTSGQQFFQRDEMESTFFSLSNNLPSGALITIIRADDWI